MRKAPTLLAAVFLAIQIARVGQFSADAMRAGILGWLFSVALALAVFASSYWTRLSATRGDVEDRRSQAVRRAAYICLGFFVCVDGWFNLAEVLRQVVDPALRVSAVIYGLFPTLAAGLLGWLQGNVDRLPSPPVSNRVNVIASARRAIVGAIDRFAATFPVTNRDWQNDVPENATGKILLPVAKNDSATSASGKKNLPLAENGNGSIVTGSEIGNENGSDNDNGKRGTYEQFAIDNRNRNGSGPMTAAEIISAYRVSLRTAYRWQDRYQSK